MIGKKNCAGKIRVMLTLFALVENYLFLVKVFVILLLLQMKINKIFRERMHAADGTSACDLLFAGQVLSPLIYGGLLLTAATVFCGGGGMYSF